MTTSTIVTVIALASGIYEVVCRVIPTVKDVSILGNIFSFLQLVSDFLNRKKA